MPGGRIRVLEVLASLRRAGAERVAVSLASRLDRMRFDTEIVSLYDAFPDGFEPVLAKEGVAAHHLGKRRGFDARMVPRLARVIRGFAPAIVHTHSYVMRYAWPAVVMAGVGRIVHTVHNLAAREVDWAGRIIHRAAFGSGTAVTVAVGREVANSFRDCYHRDPDAVILNGVDLEAFRAVPPAEVRTERRVVSVARLDPQKDPLGLLDAFHRALGSDPAWRLLLAGIGTLEPAIAAEAKRLGIGDRVQLVGSHSDIPQLLASCDIFASASDWEGMPVAVIEAMAAGLPIVATAVGGVPELVEDGVSGYLVPPGDISALADRLALLAHDAKRRTALGRAARERSARYSVEQMVESYAALFERVASRS